MARLIRLERGDHNWDYYLVSLSDGKRVLVWHQSDYHRVAQTFGWRPCHPEALWEWGLQTCPTCGKSLRLLIDDAKKYLDEHIGSVAEDTNGHFATTDLVDEWRKGGYI